MTRGLAIVLLLTSCTGGELAGVDAGARSRGGARIGGDVIATVDGHPLSRDEVLAAGRAAGVEPRVALSRLEDETLLALEAERAGLGDDREVRRATRRAAVQALLARTVEAEVTAADVDAEAVEAAYAEDPTRFDRPERRRSMHALAEVPEGAPPEVASAAEAWARSLHAELAASADPAGALAARRDRVETDLAFQVRYEEIPPLARDDAADAAYLGAIFGSAEAGLVTAPVRSAIGWHVIVVTEIEPAVHPSREEAIEALRAQHLAALRAQRLEALVRELAGRAGVSLERETIQRAFADPELLGGGE